MQNRYFPIFVPSAEKTVVVIGGGNIASRRIRTLMEFDFQVTVAAPWVSDEVKALSEAGKLKWIEKPYEKQVIADAFMVLACTDDRETNRRIGLDAKAAGILVSVCDSRAECTFYFPAIAAGEEVTCGIVGSGKDHHVTRRAAKKVREIIKGKAY